MIESNSSAVPNASYNMAQILMTLAAIAYADMSDISNELNNQNYATQGEWQLVWGPVDLEYDFYTDNLMYVVHQNGTSNYAVVIRGTVLTFALSTLYDLFEDLDVSNQYNWEYPYLSDGYVAGGTLTGLQYLTEMQDSSSGQTLLEFLSGLSNPTIYVTGHSLGGCLTTVLAPWLQYQFQQSGFQQGGVIPYTFAAPTAGNPSFATWYDENVAPNQSYRYYNTIDAIPMAWQNLAGIGNLFPNGDPACPWSMQDVITAVNDLLYWSGASYGQTNGSGSPLPGTSSGNSDWFDEIGNQHDHNTYLTLLGAPKVDITLLRRKTHYNPRLLTPQKPEGGQPVYEA